MQLSRGCRGEGEGGSPPPGTSLSPRVPSLSSVGRAAGTGGEGGCPAWGELRRGCGGLEKREAGHRVEGSPPRACTPPPPPAAPRTHRAGVTRGGCGCGNLLLILGIGSPAKSSSPHPTPRPSRPPGLPGCRGRAPTPPPPSLGHRWALPREDTGKGGGGGGGRCRGPRPPGRQAAGTAGVWGESRGPPSEGAGGRASEPRRGLQTSAAGSPSPGPARGSYGL